MQDLHLRVSVPGAPERGYRFSETPVLVGRAETCHLCVRHAAVPRELCRVWLEDAGRLVRVEERPGLTNPLLCGGTPVRGGVGGSRLELSVGPVRFVAEPARFREFRQRTDRRRRLVIALGILAATAGLAFSLGRVPGREGAPAAIDLPADPIPEDASSGDTMGGGSATARAVLLESRATDLLSGPDTKPADRIEALLDLRRATLLLPPPEAGPVARRASELERAIVAGYREQSLALGRALARGDAETASRAAANLLSYLEGHDAVAAREQLAAIAAVRAEEHRR